FKTAFLPTDSTGDAIAKLSTLYQKGHIEEYISEFRIAASLSIPTSIDKWYEKALLFKTQWTKAQAINNRAHFPSSNSHPTVCPTPQNPRYVPRTTERDPNAMDVDAVHLEQAEQDKQSKNGQCFGCGKQGHISQNCPDKNRPSRERRIRQVWQPFTPRVEEVPDEEDAVIGKASFSGVMNYEMDF
ncbi:hypothetical protein BS17DRAFT_773981, partial [Gyrodon lividus]